MTLTGYELMCATVKQTPIPGAPIPNSGIGADVGLSFLDSSLRQNHVRRITERLTLVDHGVVSKLTELHVSISKLDQSQVQASRLYSHLHGGPPVREPESEILWIPIARLPTARSSPVEVFDGDGRLLPRLTQFETSKIIAAGLYKLVRAILTTLVGSDSHNSAANRMLHGVDEARWLLESSIHNLLAIRGKPGRPTAFPKTDGTVSGPNAAIRRLVLEVLECYRADLSSFYELLQIAYYDYLIIVGLNPRAGEQTLRYNGSTTVETFGSPWKKHFTKRNLAAYRVDYTSQLPATLPAYHFVVDVDPQVAIDAIYLTTDSDQGLAESTCSELVYIAQRMSSASENVPPVFQRKYLELQLQTAARSVADLLRNRSWEANLGSQGIDATKLSAAQSLAQLVTADEAVATNTGTDSSLLMHPLVTPQLLEQAAAEIASTALGSSFSGSSDPPGSSSHSYWRRSRAIGKDHRPITVNARFILRDGSESRPRRVWTYAFVMAVLSWLVASLMARGVWPLYLVKQGPAQADAVVAILLLVPGFLYSRLDLGRRGSIIAELRKSASLVGVMCIGSATTFAAVIACSSDAILINLATSLSILVPFSSGWLLVQRSRDLDGSSGLAEVDPAPWLARAHDHVAAVDVSIRSVTSA